MMQPTSSGERKQWDLAQQQGAQTFRPFCLETRRPWLRPSKLPDAVILTRDGGRALVHYKGDRIAALSAETGGEVPEGGFKLEDDINRLCLSEDDSILLADGRKDLHLYGLKRSGPPTLLWKTPQPSSRRDCVTAASVNAAVGLVVLARSTQVIVLRVEQSEGGGRQQQQQKQQPPYTLVEDAKVRGSGSC